MSHYQKLTNILKKWPIDKSKSGRDLGERLREHLVMFQNPAIDAPIEENINSKLDSLDVLSKNIYFAKYQRLNSSTATGLSAQQCSQVLSSQFLQYLNETGDKK